MQYQLTTLFFVSLAAVGFAQLPCPPDEVLSPCFCDNATMIPMIACAGIEEPFNLKEVFDNASNYVNDDVVFPLLLISQLPHLHVIEEEAIEHLKFQMIQIARNLNLNYISPRAFGATRNITQTLTLEINNLHNDPPQERDIFQLIGSFERAGLVILDNNQISSIPDNALQNISVLAGLWLQNNRISRIGSRAFATTNPQSLELLDLKNNLISSEGVHESAFDGISIGVEVYLDCNEMEFMEKKSFQTLLDRAAVVTVGGRRCPGNENESQRFYCDERADWICDNEHEYHPKLTGFLCKNETGVEDVWEYCIRRNETNMG